MISVESEKWWRQCVQNINTSYWDQNSWISKGDMILVSRASGQENVVLHTQTHKLWLKFYAGTKRLAIFFNNVKALAWPQDPASPLSPKPWSFQRNPCIASRPQRISLSWHVDRRKEAMVTFEQNTWESNLSLAWSRIRGRIQALGISRVAEWTIPSFLLVCAF